MSNNYSMIHQAFVSPLRGINSAAVPHNKREMSSSPYVIKKKGEVILINLLNLRVLQQREFSEEDINRISLYNKSIEDAER